MTSIRFCHHLPGTYCDACRTSVPLAPSTTLPYTPYVPTDPAPVQVPHFSVGPAPTMDEFNALQARVSVLEKLLSDALEVSDDAEEPVNCAECGFQLTLVRPGKHQCDVCPALKEAWRLGAERMRYLAYKRIETLKVTDGDKMAREVFHMPVPDFIPLPR